MSQSEAEIIVSLRSSEPLQRIRGLASAVSHGALESFDVLSAAAGCIAFADPRVRRCAVNALEMAPQVPEIILAGVARLLECKDKNVAGAAASFVSKRLGAWSARLTNRLRQIGRALVRADGKEAVIGGLHLLGAAGGDDRAVLWEVQSRIDSPDPDVSIAAGDALACLRVDRSELLMLIRRRLRAGQRYGLPGVAAALARLGDEEADVIAVLPEPLPGECGYTSTVLRMIARTHILPAWGFRLILDALADPAPRVFGAGCDAWSSVTGEGDGHGLLIGSAPRRIEDSREALWSDLRVGALDATCFMRVTLSAFVRTVSGERELFHGGRLFDPHGFTTSFVAAAKMRPELRAAGHTIVTGLLCSASSRTRSVGAWLTCELQSCNRAGLCALIRWIDQREEGIVHAARALGAIDIDRPAAVTALLSVFATGNRDAMEAAAVSLGAHGEAAEPALPALVGYLKLVASVMSRAIQSIVAVASGSNERVVRLIDLIVPEIAWCEGRNEMLTFLHLLRQLHHVAGAAFSQSGTALANELDLRLITERDADVRRELEAVRIMLPEG